MKNEAFIYILIFFVFLFLYFYSKRIIAALNSPSSQFVFRFLEAIKML